MNVKKLLSALIAVLLVFSLFSGALPEAEAAINPGVTGITITGNGVNTEVTVSLAALLAMPMSAQNYSASNSFPTPKHIRAEGIWLEDLLALAGLKPEAKQIIFTATDGVYSTLTVEHLLGTLYYYPNILDGSASGAAAVRPMLAVSVADPSTGTPTDNDAPRLCFGQSAVTEQNFNDFLKFVVKIEVTTDDSGQYAPPTASPPSGTVEQDEQITLATAGGKGAKIYYTTDGSAPDRNSAIFNLSDFVPNLPITVTGNPGDTFTVKAVVYGHVRRTSEAATFTYTIGGGTTPTIIIMAPAPSQVYHPGDTVTVGGKALNTTGAVELSIKAPGGGVVYSLPSLTLDSSGNYSAGYAIPSTAALGLYTVTVREAGASGVSETVSFLVKEEEVIAPVPNDGVCPDMVLTSFGTGGAAVSRIIQARIKKGAAQTSLLYMNIADWNGSLNSGGQLSNWSGTVTSAASVKDVDAGHSLVTWNISGLAADTEYVVQVGNEGHWSAPFCFITAKSDAAAPFSFMYLGDVQEGYGQWGGMIISAFAAHRNVRLGLIGGDLVDDGQDNSEWQMFITAASAVFSEVVMAPIPGNHDDTDLFYSYLGDVLPHNGDISATKNSGYYSFDYGNAHFTMLNSNLLSAPGIGSYSAVMNWLVGDLKNAAGQDWRFVVMHYPPYPAMEAGNYNAQNLRDYWVPVFEKYGVDLVFVGHQHAYARTKPIKAGNVVGDLSQGIVYIMGDSGSKFYQAEDYDYIQTSLSFVSNYQIIDIDGNKLTFKSYDQSGNIIDSFVYEKQGSRTVSIPYTPPAGMSADDYDLLTVYYLDENGNAVEIRGAVYDPATGLVTFTTGVNAEFYVSEWVCPFSDASKGDWFYRAVRFSYGEALMNGVGDGKFAPQTPLSRAMLVTILWRLEGEPEVSGGSAFTDVEAGQWYTKAVAWASASGIVEGYGDGLFGTNDSITREQFATILYRYAKWKKLNTSGSADLGAYSDAGEVSSWALEALRWANAAGLITGRTSTTLAPGGTATRAEAATILQRFIQAFVQS